MKRKTADDYRAIFKKRQAAWEAYENAKTMRGKAARRQEDAAWKAWKSLENADVISMRLSDGSICYGKQCEPGVWRLNRCSSERYVSAQEDADAPVWARGQAEMALARGEWPVWNPLEVKIK